ncbi:MAG TPA: glycyl-radical enzyme activating protein [Chloroflexota bacterium]|nr:glycyl-radical enzyme activating protein [Chloroflexota bacterium]
MADPTGLVFNIQRYSIHDGPGIRTTVFLKGCPLRCLWCCNPESQSAQIEIGSYPDSCVGCGNCAADCPRGAIEVGPGGACLDRARCDRCGICAGVCVAGGLRQIGMRRGVADVVREVERDRTFYRISSGGVTLSGGEPTVQPEFALGLLRACKDRGIHTAMESCGHTGWDELASLLPHLDLLLYDIKQVDPERHRSLTGVSNHLILDNARRAAKSEVQMIVRVPMIPGCNDDEESVRALVDFVASLERVKEFHLLPYHRLGLNKHAALGTEALFDTTEAVSGDALSLAGKLAEVSGLTVQVGG